MMFHKSSFVGNSGIYYFKFSFYRPPQINIYLYMEIFLHNIFKSVFIKKQYFFLYCELVLMFPF